MMNPNDIWEERYSAQEFAYGKEPNVYLQERLQGLKPGKILFPADGEGRNSVYAASLGWEAFAFDLSAAGRNKALQLAESRNVKINYQVGDFTELGYKPEEFDAIALIYAHFPSAIKSTYHKKLSSYLKKGGTLIFEAFSKSHIAYNSKNPAVGGPRDLATLFSVEEIHSDFHDFEIIELAEKEVELNEGVYHIGLGSVIRFTGIKK